LYRNADQQQSRQQQQIFHQKKQQQIPQLETIYRAEDVQKERQNAFQAEFKKKEDFALTKKQMEAERLRNLAYAQMKEYLRNYDENALSLSEYKEIERNINEDKKICENCKTNIYENNY
jgi:hypothetical protein